MKKAAENIISIFEAEEDHGMGLTHFLNIEAADLARRTGLSMNGIKWSIKEELEEHEEILKERVDFL